MIFYVVTSDLSRDVWDPFNPTYNVGYSNQYNPNPKLGVLLSVYLVLCCFKVWYLSIIQFWDSG